MDQVPEMAKTLDFRSRPLARSTPWGILAYFDARAQSLEISAKFTVPRVESGGLGPRTAAGNNRRDASMRQDRLTTKFQLALADAQSLAVGRDHQFIEPAHLMLALLDQDGGSARPLLDRAGANVNLRR